MEGIRQKVPPGVLPHLSGEDKRYLEEVFSRFQGWPSLEHIWQLMDEAWAGFGCDPAVTDDRIAQFYRHPVWLLNGLFVEQHDESLYNRRIFTESILEKRPARVADYGGGFGGLARMIGKVSSSTLVEVVDPHPHPAAIALAEETENVRYVSKLSGSYDVLIATDVFEHVPDPVRLAGKMVEHLPEGGRFLIANCFEPVIRCHLPQLFHLRYAWDPVMAALGMETIRRVAYANIYVRTGSADIVSAREVAHCAERLYPGIERFPRIGRSRLGRWLVRKVCSRPRH